MIEMIRQMLDALPVEELRNEPQLHHLKGSHKIPKNLKDIKNHLKLRAWQGI